MRPVVAAILSFGGLAFGAVLSVWPKEIADATRFAVLGPVRGSLHLWVLSFWLAVGLWTLILYYRLRGDDEAQTVRFRHLTAAIHRAPNYGVFTDYIDYYDLAADAVASTHLPGAPTDERIERLSVGIGLVLELTAGLAATFTRAPQSRAYGANIMLVAKPPLDGSLVSALRFFDKENQDPNALRAVLYLPQALLLSDVGGRPDRTIPLIALPVPKSARDSRGHQIALPGAPEALLTGKASAQLDTLEMASSCGDFPAFVIDELREYFAPGGAGQGIRSFVSFRIGSEKAPVGVLNIDSEAPFVLGDELEYYPTFYALMSPLLRLLVKPVSEYGALARAKGQYIS
jgi:hypothetical protein